MSLKVLKIRTIGTKAVVTVASRDKDELDSRDARDLVLQHARGQMSRPGHSGKGDYGYIRPDNVQMTVAEFDEAVKFVDNGAEGFVFGPGLPPGGTHTLDYTLQEGA